MKKNLEKIFGILLLLLIWSCDNTPEKTGTLMDYVPQDASVVFKISDFENLQEDIKNSSLLSELSKTTPYTFFSEKASLLKNLHPSSQSLLCVNKLTDSTAAFTFISKQTKNLFQTDSIKNKTIETLKMDDRTFQRITIDKDVAYSTIIDSVFVASSSQQLIQDILNGKTERNATFKKVYNLPSSDEFTALVRSEKIAINDSTKINFTSWSSLDIAINPESFTANGISLATDSIPQLLNIFDGQVPQQNDVAALVPTDAMGALSFTFNDAEKFQKKLQNFRREKDSLNSTGIFGSVSEVGTIQLKNETVAFIKSIDPSLTADALARFISSENSFREVQISSFSESDLFQKTFSPLIESNNAKHVFQLDDFFVFTESEASAQQLISSFQNKATLKNTEYYKNTAKNLRTSSSLLIYKLQGDFAKTISAFFNPTIKADFKTISFEKFPLTALQFSYDQNFAHVTLSCNEASGGSSQIVSGGVSEKFHVKLENAVLSAPQFFSNPKTGSSNALVQDIGNKLYFISENGKIVWSKNLGNHILGKIEEIDIFGNGNEQITFTTKDGFYILDRNGKDVGGFPIKFKDEVTQPLSVFDYDNNHKYRFVVVQGKNVLMYDKNGKIVKGFGFTKAKSNIAQAPQHIRMGNKDYIIIAEDSGKLNILNRVGKSRISVSKNFNFSKIPVAEEDNTFVVITKENTKERIAESGKVSFQKLDVDSDYWFAINENTKATLDDNLLRINGKLAKLPLGLYSKQQIFKVNGHNYITITEIQENKVYVFDENGNLLPGFPVYGTSEASLSKGNSRNSLLIVVKGDQDNIIFYSNN